MNRNDGYVELPKEILAEILGYFDLVYLNTVVRLVCREWRSIADSNLVWRDICFRRFQLASFFQRIEQTSHMEIVWKNFYIQKLLEGKLRITQKDNLTISPDQYCVSFNKGLAIYSIATTELKYYGDGVHPPRRKIPSVTLNSNNNNQQATPIKSKSDKSMMSFFRRFTPKKNDINTNTPSSNDSNMSQNNNNNNNTSIMTVEDNLEDIMLGDHTTVYRLRVRYDLTPSTSAKACFCGIGVTSNTLRSSSVGEITMSAENGCSYTTFGGDFYVDKTLVPPRRRGSIDAGETVLDSNKNSAHHRFATRHNYNTSGKIVESGDTLAIQLELCKQKQMAYVKIEHNDEEMANTYLEYHPPFYFVLCLWRGAQFTVLLP